MDDNVIKMPESTPASESTLNSLWDTVFTEVPTSASDTDAGMAVIANILSLSDESFDIISEAFIMELQKQLNDSNNQMAILAELEKEGVHLSELQDETLEQVNEFIDKELPDVPQKRKDFLKRIIMETINTTSEVAGMAKKTIGIPVEICRENAQLPTYAHLTDAGMDIYATEDITINPGQTVLVPTGLKVAIPVGYELQIRPKSGRALKTKLRVANTPATLDSGYREEIGVIIENIEPPITDIDYTFDENGHIIINSILHGKSYTIGKGEKFAQLILSEVPHAYFYKVDNINEIEGDRGGGFGSTGLK